MTMSRVLIFQVFIWLCGDLCFAIAPAQSSLYLSINDSGFSAFHAQHGCVQECLGFVCGVCIPGGVVDALQCGSPVLNKCYCASTGASVASSFLSKCINSKCRLGDLPDEVTSGISVYNLYCRNAGFTLPPAAPTPETPLEAPPETPAPGVTISFPVTKTSVTKTPNVTNSGVSGSSSSVLLGSSPGSSLTKETLTSSSQTAPLTTSNGTRQVPSPTSDGGPSTTSTGNGDTPLDKDPERHSGLIVGLSVAGGLVLIIICVLFVIVWHRRKRRSKGNLPVPLRRYRTTSVAPPVHYPPQPPQPAAHTATSGTPGPFSSASTFDDDDGTIQTDSVSYAQSNVVPWLRTS